MPKKENKHDLIQQSAEELGRQADKAREDLFKLRFKSATVPQKNTMEIRNLRRHIARLQTFIKQKGNAKV